MGIGRTGEQKKEKSEREMEKKEGKARTRYGKLE